MPRIPFGTEYLGDNEDGYDVKPSVSMQAYHNLEAAYKANLEVVTALRTEFKREFFNRLNALILKNQRHQAIRLVKVYHGYTTEEATEFVRSQTLVLVNALLLDEENGITIEPLQVETTVSIKRSRAVRSNR